jgi:hypothetical protein
MPKLCDILAGGMPIRFATENIAQKKKLDSMKIYQEKIHI